ncbi:selenocysteine-specific elongation factor [Acidimicrobiaceae bacterium]|nr:selenocysteine-specific elongation factor [Acidimicrobiaceae bacterium]
MTVIATAGHVDHGKSSLVRALTGTDPDRWEEEKRRGMTIDLGFAFTVLPSGAVASFIDVPGHIRFLRNMLAGVGAIDACVLVVDAKEGWMPQTEEHFQILKLLGVANGVVALSKIDLIDGELENIRRREISERTNGSFLANAEIIATSVTTNLGLDKLCSALDQLISQSASPSASSLASQSAAASQRPRLWIDRAFTTKGAGTVVTGTLIDGCLQVGDELAVVRNQQKVRVREIQQHEQTVTKLDHSHRCALNLVGISHEEISRGDALVNLKQWKPTAMFDASLRVVPSLKHRVTRRGSYSIYIGAGEFSAKIRLIGTRELNADEQGCVRIAIDSSLALMPGDRYILRESGRQETIGGGEVLDIHPILRVSRAKPDRSLDRLIAEHGWITVSDFELLTSQRLPAVVGEWLTTPALHEALRKDLAMQLAKNPDGIEVSRLKTYEQAVVATLPEVVIEMGRARIKGANSITDHPYAGLFAHAGVTPPDTKTLDRNVIRQLVQRGLLVDVDGTVFHISALETARHKVVEILNQNPNGFTVSQFREHLGITRKHAVPLLEALDRRGITRRTDDLRVGGARLAN